MEVVLVKYLPCGKCEIIPDGIVKFSADAESEVKFALNTCEANFTTKQLHCRRHSRPCAREFSGTVCTNFSSRPCAEGIDLETSSKSGDRLRWRGCLRKANSKKHPPFVSVIRSFFGGTKAPPYQM